MAARVMLGVFEAGFGPSIPLYFCERDHDCCYVDNRIHALPTAFYYTKKEMGQRVSVICSSFSQVLNLFRWPGGLALQL